MKRRKNGRRTGRWKMRRERKDEGLEAGGEEDEICRMKKRRRIRRRMKMNTVLRIALSI